MAVTGQDGREDEKGQICEKSGIPEKNRKYRYCVLYTNVLKQAQLNSVLKQALPEGRGTVFYPCMECYRRDAGGRIEIQPLFPGYIFIRSDLGVDELHRFIREHSSRLMTFVRELKFSEKKAFGEDAFAKRNMGFVGGDVFEDDIASQDSGKVTDSNMSGRKDAEYRLSDLTEEEAEFLDFLLDVDKTGGGSSSGTAKEAGRADTPAEGLLKMSYGYLENGKYKVLKGPLRAYEDHIAGVNRHDKKAFLDFGINGRVIKAGFDVRPKRYWFPEDKDTPEMLGDGTEVDLKELAKAMMR